VVPVSFLRALSNQFLPDVCTVQRSTETVTGDGTTQSWSTLASGVACRVSPLASGANEGLGADQSMQAVSQWTVWLPAGQDVTVKDRLVVGARTFEIARVGERSYEVSRECLCREVT
jgi:head-tail adaptor